MKVKKYFLCTQAGSTILGTADLYGVLPRQATYSITAEIPEEQPFLVH